MGSNPTPRTITTPTYLISEFEEFLRTTVTKKGASLVEATIKHRVKVIKSLLKRVNLWDCEAVQEYIDRANWTNGRKEHVRGIGVLVKRKPIDPALVSEGMSSYILMIWDKYGSLVKEFREHANRPEVFEGFYHLYEEIKKSYKQRHDHKWAPQQ